MGHFMQVQFLMDFQDRTLYGNDCVCGSCVRVRVREMRKSLAECLDEWLADVRGMLKKEAGNEWVSSEPSRGDDTK